MENSLKLLETPEKNSDEKLLEKLPETSFPSSETIEIYDLDSEKRLDFNKTFDSKGALFDPALHVFEEKGGKTYVRTTLTGKLRLWPKAEQRAHQEVAALKVAQVEEEKRVQMDKARQEVAASQESAKKKQYIKDSATYTAGIITECFFEVGSWLFGKSFKPSGEDQDVEADRLKKAVSDWVVYHEISMTPDMALTTVAASYIARHRPEPDSPVGKLISGKKKVEAKEVAEDEPENN